MIEKEILNRYPIQISVIFYDLGDVNNKVAKICCFRTEEDTLYV